MDKHEKRECVQEGGLQGEYCYKHPHTIWEQIREEIIVLIICGELRIGEKAPSLTEVTEKYHCGRTTAQKVMESLCESDILEVIPGKGFFVKKTRNLKDILEKEYRETMEDTLKKYIVMGKHIGMTDEELIQQLLTSLQIKR